jgi:hypothetical protein
MASDYTPEYTRGGPGDVIYMRPGDTVQADGSVRRFNPDYDELRADGGANFDVKKVDNSAIRKALLDEAVGKGRTGINEAFTKYGLDPAKYGTNIEGRIASILSNVPTTQNDNFDPLFAGLGDKLLTDMEIPYRNTAKTALSAKMPKDWVPMTADDAFIESILGGQRTEADNYVKNMLSRGLLTDDGATAAYKELDRQKGLALPQLSEIGTGLINTGESNIDAEQAKKLASYDTLKIDQPYDVEADYKGLNQLATDFIGTLGTGIEGALGGKKFFNTSSFGGSQGASQGTGGSTVGGGAIGGGGQNVDPNDDEDKTGQEVLF